MSNAIKSKARFDETLFVHQGVKSKITSADGLASLSKDTLAERVNDADSVVVISPYYDVSFLEDVFGRRANINGKQIDMVFARPSPAALPQQIEELTNMRAEILRSGNVKTRVNVFIAGDARFLHTKLYIFRRGSEVCTLIGSANATLNGFCKSDEILIELRGDRSSIRQYVTHTLMSAENTNGVVFSPNEQYRDFESMLRDGFIYFKPTRSVPYTIDCFDNNPKVSKSLEKIVGGNPLPSHEGQSVGLLNIMRLFKIGAQKETIQRVKISSLAVETSLGYWVPTAYQPELEAKLANSTRKKTKAYLARGERLSQISNEKASDIVKNEYLKKIDHRLKGASAALLSQKDKQDIERRILQRTDRLRTILTSEEECERLARALHGTAVPEIWEDPQSRKEMEQSFCEYISWKLGPRKSLPKIVGKIQEWFELARGDEAGEIRSKIETFFDGGKTHNRGQWEGDSPEDDRQRYWVGYWRNSPSTDEEEWDADEYFDDLQKLRKRVDIVLAANRYRYAYLLKRKSASDDWEEKPFGVIQAS